MFTKETILPRQLAYKMNTIVKGQMKQNAFQIGMIYFESDNLILQLFNYSHTRRQFSIQRARRVTSPSRSASFYLYENGGKKSSKQSDNSWYAEFPFRWSRYRLQPDQPENRPSDNMRFSKRTANQQISRFFQWQVSHQQILCHHTVRTNSQDPHLFYCSTNHWSEHNGRTKFGYQPKTRISNSRN